ncbi:hypothetical protein Peur_002611 [Populus x canadensis]
MPLRQFCLVEFGDSGRSGEIGKYIDNVLALEGPSGFKLDDIYTKMESKEDEEYKKVQLVDPRARNISHSVTCTECGVSPLKILKQILQFSLGRYKHCHGRCPD